MKKKLLDFKEIARDTISLGSIPFLILVVVRIWILDDPLYLLQFVLASLLFFIPAFILKSDFYSGISLIIAILLSIYYNDVRFVLMAFIMYILIIMSLIYIKKDKMKILQGSVLGLISSLLGYYFAGVLIG